MTFRAETCWKVPQEQVVVIVTILVNRYQHHCLHAIEGFIALRCLHVTSRHLAQPIEHLQGTLLPWNGVLPNSEPCQV